MGLAHGNTCHLPLTQMELGDTLVIYSDGLPDARPELELGALGVARELAGLTEAQAMLDQLVSLVATVEKRDVKVNCRIARGAHVGAITVEIDDPGP